MADESKIVPIGGPGFGTLEQHGVDQLVIDTAQPGFPEKRIDVMFTPAGDWQPVTALQIPRGSIVVFYRPEVAAQMRAHLKAAVAQAEKLRQTRPPLGPVH